jgi:hypothetical protein
MQSMGVLTRFYPGGAFERPAADHENGTRPLNL